MRNIGDVYAYLKCTIRVFFERQSIIKILCISGVYGKCEHISVITPVRFFRVSERLRELIFFVFTFYLFRLNFNLFRKIWLKTALQNNGEHFSVMFTSAAYDTQNFSFRRFQRVFPRNNFYKDFIAIFRPAGFTLVHKKVSVHSFIIWVNEKEVFAGSLYRCSDELFFAARNYRNNLRLRLAPRRFRAKSAYRDLITMKSDIHFFGSDFQISFFIIGPAEISHPPGGGYDFP